MKLLVLLGFLAVAHSQVSDKRLSSLDVLEKLSQHIPNYKDATDLAFLRISEAKKKASEVLNGFYSDTLKIKSESLQSMIDLELDMLKYGESVDQWCWENNIPILEGRMGWVGDAYCYCIKQLDNSITDVVANITGRFHDDETNIRKYSLLEVFEKKNIINEPQSIIDAISKLDTSVLDAIPELTDAVASFETDLHKELSGYTSCLTQELEGEIRRIQDLKEDTEKCLSRLPQS